MQTPETINALSIVLDLAYQNRLEDTEGDQALEEMQAIQDKSLDVVSQMLEECKHEIGLDGFNVKLYRNDEGVVVIDLDSSETGPGDECPEGCPKFEMRINEALYRPHPSGEGWQSNHDGNGWENDQS